MNTNIVIRYVDDWIAIYKDGKKVWENHSCDIVDGLQALGIPFEAYDIEAQHPQDAIEANPESFFPEKLGDERATDVQ